jgi:hypothetical protein
MTLGAVAAVVLGGILGGLADWYFMGVLFHDKYLAYPEVWRPRDTNTYAIALGQGLTFVSAVAFVVLAISLGLTDFWQTFTLALWIWLIGPLPLWISTWSFMKIHPLIVVAHTAGWLVKLLAMAFVTALFL